MGVSPNFQESTVSIYFSTIFVIFDDFFTLASKLKEKIQAHTKPAPLHFTLPPSLF